MKFNFKQIKFKQVLHNFWFKLNRDEKIVIVFPLAILFILLVCAIA